MQLVTNQIHSTHAENYVTLTKKYVCFNKHEYYSQNLRRLLLQKIHSVVFLKFLSLLISANKKVRD